MGVTVLTPAEAFVEGGGGRLGVTFVDALGVAINAANVLTLTATLKSAETDVVINSRSAQSVLNVNGGSAPAAPDVFALMLSAADTAVLAGEATLGKRFLKRRLTLQGTFNDGGTPRPLVEEISFYVRALEDVP